MNKHVWAAVSAATASALVLAGCSSGSGSSPSSESATAAVDGATPATLMLPFPRGIFWTPLMVAEEQGYFADQGLDLSIEEADGSGFVTQQLIAGNVDFGFSGAASAVVAAETDPNIRIPMCYPASNIFIIVTPEGSDVASVADLRGKTLGITEAGGGEEPIVNAALAESGLTPNGDVTLLPIGGAGPQSLTALQDGTVDAYATSFADLATFTAAGNKFTDITPESLNVIPGDCLVSTAAALEDPAKREIAVKIARAFAMGAAFTDANPEGALDIVCKTVPEECTDMNYAQVYFDEVRRYAGSYDPATPYGAVSAEGWQTTVDVLTDSGVIKGSADPVAMGSGDDITSLQQEYSEIDLPAVQEHAQQYAP
ncbi:ABC transporter substrate-binding protein [Mycolicibacterium tokaiense]|uniref:Substrate-binding protein, ABC-type transporter n=1 Tax=Mycolicibacterium tokaiense TaxID=39695 RepID=A0A378TBG0_9MYCO|nr:ABC transporter substrate-binding protein [Mycolicibacterium tokaiense]STZ58172.1 substrate-binding protein, ABC-type transporter [Mycolicibacterium tokaiense]